MHFKMLYLKKIQRNIYISVKENQSPLQALEWFQ